ncbi:MAG: glycosyl hydrolase family 18 protein [Gammaproteobacteria bacterium]
MRFIKKLIMTMIGCLGLISLSYAGENLFYALRSDDPSQITSMQNTLASLKNHYKSIDIIVSQAYQIDQNGMFWGYVDPELKSFAKSHSMKLMVLITNAGFDKEKTHKFLVNESAQQRAIQSILTACEKNHFYGVQFDFEMIPFVDRDVLTHFYVTATEALHKKGLIVSYAIAPLVGENPQASAYLKKLYTVWEGAYDLKALSKSADFLTIMAYNQHGEGTTPGATAGAPWVEQTIKYTLQYVPAAKLSLGIATYSMYWFTAGSPSSKIYMHATDIAYDKAIYLLEKYHATFRWDDVEKVNYAIYDHNWLNEYIFAEDAKSFRAKLDLVKKYNLRGISVFDLGIEDPKIWDELAGKA